MNLDIRKAVLANLANATDQDVRGTITDAINMREEKVLPGLGVLFELYWNSANEATRSQVVSAIAGNLRQ